MTSTYKVYDTAHNNQLYARQYQILLTQLKLSLKTIPNHGRAHIHITIHTIGSSIYYYKLPKLLEHNPFYSPANFV